MIIGVDVDGVLADLHGELLRRYNRDYDDCLKLEDINTWSMHDLVKPECGVKIYDYFSAPDFYDHVPVIRGAQRGIDLLKNMGHRVVYVTSNRIGMTDPKWRWLQQNGFLGDSHTEDNLIIAHDKNLVDVPFLIDDRAETIERWVDEKRRRGILFRQPWNQWLRDSKPSAFWNFCAYAGDWPTVVRIIEQFTEACDELVHQA